MAKLKPNLRRSGIERALSACSSSKAFGEAVARAALAAAAEKIGTGTKATSIELTWTITVSAVETDHEGHDLSHEATQCYQVWVDPKVQKYYLGKPFYIVCTGQLAD